MMLTVPFNSLLLLSDKCNNIELRCKDMGDASRDLQLPEVIESVREIIQEQLSSPVERSNFISTAKETSTHALGNFDSRERVQHLTDILNKRLNTASGPDTVRSVLDDITGIVDGLKSINERSRSDGTCPAKPRRLLNQRDTLYAGYHPEYVFSKSTVLEQSSPRVTYFKEYGLILVRLRLPAY
jgi:hypothetical protein